MRPTPNPRLLLICFDSLNWDLAKEWAVQGLLPNFASCLASQVTGRIECQNGLPTDAVWQSFYTGAKAEQLTFTQPEPFWVRMAQSGLRVIVVDSPKYHEVSEVNGVWISKWYSHDSPGYEVRAFPKMQLKGGFIKNFGAYEYAYRKKIVAPLLASIDHKTSETQRLLAQDWDFAAVFFAESHFIGHAFWPASSDREYLLSNPILTIYRRLDDALGKLLSVSNSDVLVASLQGMQINTSLNGILPGLLDEFDKTYFPKDLPPELKRVVRRIGSKIRRRLPEKVLQGASQRVLNQVGSGFSGAIRVNLKGREPDGVVDKADFDLLVDNLKTFFSSLRDEETHRHLVAETVITNSKNSRMPDLLIIWSRNGRARSVIGPFKGSIPVRYDRSRAGHHTSYGGYAFVQQLRNIGLKPSITETEIPRAVFRYFSLHEP